MQLRGSRLKFTAVAVLVVLSLTGFSSGRGHGSSSSGGSSSSDGGGCSSSGQDHDSSSSSTSGGGTYRDYDDDDDDDYGSSGSSSGGSTSTAPADAEVELVSCVTEADAYATVEVTNPNSVGHYFTVTVRFLDADSQQVDVQSVDEFVAANDKAKVQVPLDNPGLAAEVVKCDPDLFASAD
ncbi:hypothetical protein [Streptomyces sp. V4I2]|uniref:hypothetical protein n=1 Tax=Streptomyces sp. V4I2 TaxID=3042280 RepID=UPI002781C895|nr:hypothetical protein [Streptomyces sp. V4I2]MDQ1046449.1 hypothetical protein [Streptomyces sp. V4I2]